MDQRLLILGASARAAAQSAQRAGFTIRAADCFADDDLTALGPTTAINDFPLGFSKWADDQPPTPWIYTGGLENHPALVDQIASRHPLLGNRGEVLRRVRDPWQLNESLGRAGFRVPAIAKEPPLTFSSDRTWLRKPLRSGGGIGIDFLQKNERHSADAFYYQEYVPGESIGAILVGYPAQARLVGVCGQLIGCEWAGADRFLYCGSIGPLQLPTALQSELTTLGNFLVREFKLRGIFGVDAIVHQNHVWPIEVNPRYTASVELLERALCLPAIAEHVRACNCETQGNAAPTLSTDLHADSIAEKENGLLCGKAVVYARRSAITGATFSDFVRRQNADSPWPVIADIPRIGTKLERGQPIVTVFAQGETPENVLHSLQDASHQIHSFFEKEHSPT